MLLWKGCFKKVPQELLVAIMFVRICSFTYLSAVCVAEKIIWKQFDVVTRFAACVPLVSPEFCVRGWCGSDLFRAQYAVYRVPSDCVLSAPCHTEPVGGALKPLVPLQLTPQTVPGGGAAPGGPATAAGTGQVRAGQEMFRPAAEKQMVVTEPPPEYEFTADPPSISSVDL